MSHIQSVFDLNPDVMELVLYQVTRCYHNTVMEEFQMPLVRKAYKRYLKYGKSVYAHERTHPGRHLLRIIHPSWPNNISPIEGYSYGHSIDYPTINLCGLIFVSDWEGHTGNFLSSLTNDLNVPDINALLKESKIKRYSKLKKEEKLRLLVKHYMSLD